jgi:hypothetical protein
VPLKSRIRTHRLRRLLEDWENRRRGRPIPARADFSPNDFRYVLGDLSLVDVIHRTSGLQFRYRVYGTNLVGRFGRELTGKSVDDIAHPEQARLARNHFEEVVAARRPIAYLRNHRFVDRETPNPCEVLVLPLSSDGENINMLISAFGWDV